MQGSSKEAVGKELLQFGAMLHGLKFANWIPSKIFWLQQMSCDRRCSQWPSYAALNLP